MYETLAFCVVLMGLIVLNWLFGNRGRRGR